MLKSLLGIARQWSHEKRSILTLNKALVMLEFYYIECGLLTVIAAQ